MTTPLDAATPGTSASPTPAAELVARLRLSATAGLSPRRQARLVRALGSAERVLRASPATLRTVVDAARADLVATAPDAAAALDELARLRRAGAVALWPGAPGWPEGLDDLADPPLVMFARGAQDWTRTAAVAVVGSRRASAYGLACAHRIAAELAALGMVVVSGLARGVDTAAHEGALSVGGRTVAVLGGGLARPYPPENVPLLRAIVSRAGAVLTEFPLDLPPRPYHFPRRNRVLAALSKAIVVVEAGEKSGSLITADHALDIGREVLAVPGRSDHPNSRGTHRLLREGAALCEGAADVLRALGLVAGDERDGDAAVDPLAAAGPPLDPVEAVLLSHLVGVERHTDDLIALGELDAGAALAALTGLELRGVLRQGADGRWARGP